MSDEIILFPGLGEYRAEYVRPAQDEFDEAVGRGEVTAEVSRKYMLALDEYAVNILDTPGAPGWMSVMPTAHDAAVRRGAERELTWIESERSRILGHNNGFLDMS